MCVEFSQDAKVHMSKSRRTKEESYLRDLKEKRPIAWGLKKDERWSALDNAVASKLHSCSKLLEETIYEEGLEIFGYILEQKEGLEQLLLQEN